MSLSFFINNIHFALELMGAVVFLMAAWLSFDSYSIRKETATFLRTIGFSLCALWQVIYALGGNTDVLSYFGFGAFLIGLVCIFGSFRPHGGLKMQAVVVLPSFAIWSPYLHAFAALLLGGIAYLSYRHAKKDLNETWRPFFLGFAFLGFAALLQIAGGASTGMFSIAALLCEAVGFALLVKWVWQYLALRVQESLVLIFISATLFLSTVVTLAFSTILIGQITSQTDADLLTNAKVLNLTIKGLEEQSLAKTALFAADPQLQTAVAKNDFTALGQLSETVLETHNLGFVTIVDAAGSVLVRAHALSRRGDSLLGERAVEEALQGNVFVTIEQSPVEKLSIRAGAPIRQGTKIIGAVIAGYPLDNALVDNLKRLSGLDMFLYDKDTSAAATAFASDGRTRLTGISLANPALLESVLAEGKTLTTQVELFGKPFRASYVPLQNGDNKIIGMISAAKPEQDILDIENATNRLTLITIILIMLVLAWPMYIFTKRLTAEG